MSRKSARKILFELIFELCFHKPEDSSTYENFINNTSLEQENVEFIRSMYEGIVNNFDDIIDIIKNNIKGYTIERLFKIDLAILVVSTYELVYDKTTPVNVVVNEGVEIAKKYSTDKSPGFINAVLANIMNTIK